MIGRRRRPTVPPPTVERVGREALRVTGPGGRNLDVGCDSYDGVLSVFLPPALRWVDGTPTTAEDLAWAERVIGEYAAESGYRLSVNRT